eukprot:7038224-Prymnesium_polylepis.2
MDRELERNESAGEEELKQIMKSILDAPNNAEVAGAKHAVGLAVKLALIALKRRKALDPSAPPPTSEAGQRALEYLRNNVPETTVVLLWPRIMARTDPIYEAIEDLLPVFEAAMKQLITDAQLNVTNDLILAPALKDPVRVHEKVLDDCALLRLDPQPSDALLTIPNPLTHF